ncbi:MAG: threonine--tRNA ligase [Deltaproteobacteria bacterium]|nr:threonine--tRNA ligase [Deltaproteobacteria bacterium]
MITVHTKDQGSIQVDDGAALGEIARAHAGKQAGVIAARLDGNLCDLSVKPGDGAQVEFVTADSPEGLEILRHSTSHVMADAVKRLYPDTKLTIGPAVEDGFYYDFDTAHAFAPEDLPKIEAEMARIIKEDLPFVREDVSREEAERLFSEKGESYKLEILRELEPGPISIYRHGQFVDLCRGPHVPRTGGIKAFKLMSFAGAYWRGDEHNKMLQRLYGTAFKTKEQLDKHVRRIEEAKKRDHRRLGRELDLFSTSEDVGGGLILWHPKGALIRKLIEDFWRERHLENGYDLVFSPHIGRENLWQTSGHLGFYRENMYSPMDIDGQNYFIKPMNCPFHIQIFRSRQRSYRDLPIRYAELGTVYRYERSGVLHGLMRVRGFTQDDAHIFCRPDQLSAEVEGLIDFSVYMLRSFGFSEFDTYLSTRPEKFAGAPARWDAATEALRSGLVAKGLPFQVDPGEGVFYGPKIDIKVKDSLGRAWQCTTIQVDFNLPERFGVEYIGDDNAPHQPYVLHRALLGSLERFFGVLTEHHAGAFPVWLSPVQAVVIPVSERHVEYARKVRGEVAGAGFRVQADERNEKLGYKIREGEMQKIPFMLVVGDREVADGGVSPRTRGREDLKFMTIESFVSLLRERAVRPAPRRG